MDRRTLLAFFIIGLLTVGFMVYSNKQQQKVAEHAGQTAAQESKTTTTTLPGKAAETKEPAITAPVAATPATQVPERKVSFNTDGIESIWSNEGAALLSARLKDYPERVVKKGDAAPDLNVGVMILEESGEKATFGMEDPNGIMPFDKAHYEIVEATKAKLAFAAQFENGIRAIKEFTPGKDKHSINVRLKFENTTDKPIPVQYKLWAASRIVPEEQGDVTVQGVIGWRARNGGVGIDRKNPTAARPEKDGTPSEDSVKFNEAEKPILWAGATNRYFAAVLKPVVKKDIDTLGIIKQTQMEYLAQTDTTRGSAGGNKPIDNLRIAIVSTERAVPAQGAIEDNYIYFLGPKKQDVLDKYDTLSGLLDYGVFGFISRPLLALLNLFYRLIPNYGVGIILLTVIVKLALFPLTRKGQIAMHRMQRLQPHVKAIQEKYKDDRQRQGREMMELYRRHNANPMSGCLPLFLQIPIFFGLFRMLGSSIDLRHQGFVSWINDLAQPDTIATLGNFPVNILPVVMIVTWVFQQMTMPKPADPQQAQTQKMMMFMPIIMGIFLYGMASGLTLYWVVSTSIGIIEQKLIRMQIHHKEKRGEFDVAQVVETPKQRRK